MKTSIFTTRSKDNNRAPLYIARSAWRSFTALGLLTLLSIAGAAQNLDGKAGTPAKQPRTPVSRFIVRVLIPVTKVQGEASEPKQVVDLLFPNWQELAVPLAGDPDREDLMIGLGLNG